MDDVRTRLQRAAFSPLTQINANNVTQLGLAWYADLAERGGVYERP
jgi:glucose dehydrogenase